jgi:hypothetical protein
MVAARCGGRAGRRDGAVRVLARPLRAAILTVAILLTYGAAPAPAPRVITWTACPEDPQVQCGTMRVPADWAKPDGPATTLTIARRPAPDPAARIGGCLL